MDILRYYLINRYSFLYDVCLLYFYKSVFLQEHTMDELCVRDIKEEPAVKRNR